MNNLKLVPRLMVFTVVAQKHSFTQAAKHLGISKSAVSQQITQLERELGIRLLNRTTRELSLTALGSQLLERCVVLQDQVSLLFNDLSEEGVTPSGRFAVTFAHSLQDSIILPAIEQLCIEYPNIEPVLIADDQSLDLVENQLDMAIHIGELPDSSYRALPVGSLTEVFCASATYIQRHGEIHTQQDLTEHRWIASSWQHAQTLVTDLSTQKQETVQLKQFAKNNSLPASVGMALRHLGIVLVPDILAKPLIESGELVHIAKQIQGPKWPVYAIHPYQQDKPIHLTRFYQLICHRFESV
ncbi:LysR family transcriptional regulator [Marinicellulosiphila megalodicopiae]|uniref:LysR family transcriptional regulator n=1 Tax=Marinicellulosiphila megalodicopiae TaxID=2724896 RepID=UPI003BB01055